MRMKHKWDGITLELKGKEGVPFAFKQRFDGATEETKVLLHNEQVNLENVTVKIGGFDVEVEMSVEESIQQIKNARDICSLIREETSNFVDFFPTIAAKIEGVATQMNGKPAAEPAEEATVVVPPTNATVESIIEAGIRSIKEAVGKATGKTA